MKRGPWPGATGTITQATRKRSINKRAALKHRGPTSTVNGQASKALVQQTSKHGPWNKFQALVTEVLNKNK